MRKRILFGTLLMAGILFCFGAMTYAQPMDPPWGVEPGHGAPYGQGWNYCPYCGRPAPGWGSGMGPGMMGPWMMGPGYYGMGPWMMGRNYYGMGPGMMGPGYGYGPHYWRHERYKPLNMDEAKNLVENYVKSSGNPNLKLGKVEDKGDYFEAEIDTKDGSLVNKLEVDKDTGQIESVY